MGSELLITGSIFKIACDNNYLLKKKMITFARWTIVTEVTFVISQGCD